MITENLSTLKIHKLTKAQYERELVAGRIDVNALYLTPYEVDTTITDHISNTSNPHGVTKTQVGLSNVDNTSDINKPISTAVQNALNSKADTSDIPTKTSQLTNDSGFKTTDNDTTYDLAASASSANGNVKLNLTAGGSGSGTDSVTIKGSGATTVTTDANGVITISSTDTNTADTNYYHTPTSNSGIKIADGTGVADMYVPTGTSSSTVAPGNHTHSYNSLIDKPTIPPAITVDSALSNTSTNPVQNKVIQSALAGKAASSHTHDDRYYTESEVDSKLNGKANSSHGNHVPATQNANNAVFLRNDNTWATVTPANIGAAPTSHSHNYNDLTNKPTIPTVNNATLTIQKNGTNVATFTANSATNATANITVPTGAAADKGVDTSISAGSTSTNLPTSKAVAAFVEGKGYKTTDNNTTYTVATGDGNGQIKVTPSSGSAYNVSVKGLGSAAFTEFSAYEASGSAGMALSQAKTYTDDAVAQKSQVKIKTWTVSDV